MRCSKERVCINNIPSGVSFPSHVGLGVIKHICCGSIECDFLYTFETFMEGSVAFRHGYKWKMHMRCAHSNIIKFVI